MKYAVAVLYNNRNPLSSVDYPAVTDALLSGGVFADEVCLLPYDDPAAVAAALIRLSAACDGLFLVCDRVLVSAAREAASQAAGKPFSDDVLCETEKCLFAVVSEGEKGAALVREKVIPAVDRRRGTSYRRVVLRTVSAPADKIRTAMKAAEACGKGKFFLHAGERYGCGRIELVYDAETPKMAVDEAVGLLARELSDWVYAVDDVSVEQRLFEALKLHRLKISTAESFTAGAVGRAIISNPGASEVFYEGINAYDNRAKTARLGVKESTLKARGAVSDETAYEMAAGLICEGNCDIAIATTGIAGPDSDGTDKPAGLCFLAVGTRERVRVFRYRLGGDRETVTRTAVNLALFHALKEIR